MTITFEKCVAEIKQLRSKVNEVQKVFHPQQNQEMVETTLYTKAGTETVRVVRGKKQQCRSASLYWKCECELEHCTAT